MRPRTIPLYYDSSFLNEDHGVGVERGGEGFVQWVVSNNVRVVGEFLRDEVPVVDESVLHSVDVVVEVVEVKTLLSGRQVQPVRQVVVCW